ncbi:MAG: suppressor of fused domain protein [Lachnospiraceae bacterium]|nr:suppressor of fused domain protein [Lachnospiraceae bacterium]
MADTIFFTLKLKRGRKPLEVFEKMSKKIKKTWATKNWNYNIDEENETFCIDFGDDKSENFVLHFDKQIADGFCKVYFPLEGELFENEKKSELKSLLNMIYSVRTSFSSIKITDDYGIAEDFIESKKYKLKIRELSNEELVRAKRVFEAGYTEYPDFLLRVLYDYMDIPYDKSFEDYIDRNISCTVFDFIDKRYFLPFIETFLRETSEYGGLGRLYLIFDYYYELSGVYYSVYALGLMLSEIIHADNMVYADNFFFGVKHAQARKYYKDKFLPLIEGEEDALEKCILIYKFFVSLYDFCGFEYVGTDKLLHDYEANLGPVLFASAVHHKPGEIIYDYTEGLGNILPVRRYYYKNDKKYIVQKEYDNAIDGYTIYITLGLSNYSRFINKKCELVMLFNDDIEASGKAMMKIIMKTIKEKYDFSDSLLISDCDINYYAEGFEERHSKNAVYITQKDNVINKLPFITNECELYIAFFITKQEAEYIKEYGHKKFEEELNKNNVDIGNINRKSII